MKQGQHLRRAWASTAALGHDPPAGENAAIIAGVVAGSLGALGVLYDRYSDDVRRFVLRRTLRSGDAGDVVPDVFLTVQYAGATYDGRERPRARSG